MRFVSVAALMGAGLMLAPAVQAQDTASDATSNDTTFRGFRAEAQIGGDRFQSQGTHDDKLGFGAAVGFDGVIANKIVVGPEFSYWRGRGENVTPGGAGGTVAQKSFEEYGAAVRAGYLVTPKVLVYGLGGYVNSEQRLAYSGAAGTGAGAFYDHYNVSGYQLGGGAEYSLTKNLYTGVGYRYSNYDDHTTRQRIFASAGVRF
jgi:outer membrane immunogenic protein